MVAGKEKLKSRKVARNQWQSREGIATMERVASIIASMWIVDTTVCKFAKIVRS
jgi:hypothetical protein